MPHEPGGLQVDNPDSHLDHLLAPASLETPWYKDLVVSVKELIHPPKLPPLEVTSKPVDLPSVWGFYGGNETRAGFSSLLIHCAVIGLIFWIGSLKPVQKMAQQVVDLVAPPLSAYVPEKKDTMHGGGGGGTRAPLEASKGKLPKIAPRQFTPPRVDPPEHPKLPMVPTIVSEVQPPDVNMPNYGDPMSHLGIPSNGTGLGGGIGSGIGGGVGSGKGPGVGPGSGGGFGGGAYRIGGGVSPPSVISKVEPEYSEEARKAKWQGTVILQLVVDEHGMPRDMRVTRSLGLGLDQKAIEAVGKWRFKPGMKDGKPVPVIATIEVNFRLL
ncbi:MAG TPA: energy transducer TonB [Bryobacteraceae bacterium]|nr:energy transducer TonB [Bryobacteraceae bacterium]